MTTRRINYFVHFPPHWSPIGGPQIRSLGAPGTQEPADLVGNVALLDDGLLAAGLRPALLGASGFGVRFFHVGKIRGEMGEDNLGDFCFFLNILLYFLFFLGLYYSQMAN